jgi:hypothetical protein
VIKEKKGETEKLFEERPDGWERFERAIDAAVKSGQRHRQKPNKHSSGLMSRVSKGGLKKSAS